ncbi:MAG: YciI family protein [Actinomycetota bacterium]|nr:YciI family protein [Actinomycetota bacterium]
MHYAIHALDRSDAGDLRARTRPDHLAYLAGFEVTFGGPLLDDDGQMCGSLIVLDVDTREAAEEFAAGDPYAVAGLFERVTITGFRPVLGT